MPVTGPLTDRVTGDLDAVRMGVGPIWQQIAGISTYATVAVANGSSFTGAQSIKGFFVSRNFSRLRIKMGNFLKSVTLPDVTYKVWIYDPATQTKTQGLCNGATSATISDSQIATFDVALAVSNGAAANLAGKMLFLIVDAVYASAPSAFPGALWVGSFGDANRFGNSLADPSSLFTGRTNTFSPLPPVAIEGIVSTKGVVVGVLGDSIGAEWGQDSAKYPYYGYIPLGLNAAGIPFTVCGQSGLSLNAFFGSWTLAQRQVFYSIWAAAGVTHVLCELATNDVISFTGSFLINWLNSLQSEVQTYVGSSVKVIPITCQPRTDNTNTTTPAGSANTFTNRAAYNALIVSGNGIGNGYFDLATLLQNAGSPNLWRTDLNKVSSMAVNAPGSGYSDGDWVFLPSGIIAQINATAGAITGVSSIINPGGFVSAASPQGVSNGRIATTVSSYIIGGPLGGVGATFDLTTAATNFNSADGTHPGQSYHAYAAFSASGLAAVAPTLFT